MIDRRTLLVGSLAGLALPNLAKAQPPGGGGGGGQPPGGGGGTGGAPAGGGGGFASRLNQNEAQRQGRQDQAGRQMPEGMPQPQPPRIQSLILSQNYRDTAFALPNVANDALLMAQSFRRLAFDGVAVHADGGAPETARQVSDYLRNIDGNTIAILYAAGHGIEVNGENLLRLGNGSYLSLQSLVQVLQARAGVTILFLDACRRAPAQVAPMRADALTVVRADPGEPDQVVRLQTVEMEAQRRSAAADVGPLGPFWVQGSGIRIVFSTDPANVALDGVRPDSRYSPFAQSLARRIREPVSLDDIIALTTGDVLRATRRAQSPWSQGSIGRPIFLSGRRRRTQEALNRS